MTSRRKPGIKINRDPEGVRQLQAQLGAQQAAATAATGVLQGDLQPPYFAQLVVAQVRALGTAATPRTVARALLAQVPPGAQLLCNHTPVTPATVRQVAYRLQKDGQLLVEGTGTDAQLVAL